jgi:hypothetical protein
VVTRGYSHQLKKKFWGTPSDLTIGSKHIFLSTRRVVSGPRGHLPAYLGDNEAHGPLERRVR